MFKTSHAVLLEFENCPEQYLHTGLTVFWLILYLDPVTVLWRKFRGKNVFSIFDEMGGSSLQAYENADFIEYSIRHSSVTLFGTPSLISLSNRATRDQIRPWQRYNSVLCLLSDYYLLSFVYGHQCQETSLQMVATISASSFSWSCFLKNLSSGSQPL